MHIERMEDSKTITTSIRPSGIEIKEAYDGKYVTTGNRVVDMDAEIDATKKYTEISKYTDAIDPASADGRASIIKYAQNDNAEKDLFFPITTTFVKQCCDGHVAGTTNLDCPQSGTPHADAECSASVTAATKANTLILKILANGNALTLKTKDSSDNNVYQGVELYPPTLDNDGSAANGFFGMAQIDNTGTNDNTKLCLGSNGAKICSTYSNYVTYEKAAQGTTSEKYLYNQWHTQSEYLELHTVCYAGYNPDQEKVCGAAENNGLGVVMRDVTLNIVSNHLYPHQSDLDFIMCFRYTTAVDTSSFALGGTTILASSTVINAQLINIKSDSTDDCAITGSHFRIGILNYFVDSYQDNIPSYVPTLLRIGGYLQSAEATANEGLAFFFDDSKIVIDGESFGSSVVLNPATCGSPTHTGMVCRWLNLKQITGANTIGDMHSDYYPGLNAIIIGGATISAASEFNFYIPVQIQSPPFTHAFIALIQEHSTFPTVTSVYKQYGTKEFDGSDFVDIGPATNAIFTASTAKWTNTYAASATTTLNNEGDWEQYGATLGVLNTYGADMVKSNNLGWKEDDPIYPGDTETDAQIDASMESSSGIADTMNDDTSAGLGMTKALYAPLASAHYMIHSSIKYWNGATITWSLQNASNIFQARCTDMAITSYYDSTHSPTAYAVICPYEGKFADGTPIKDLGSLYVTFSTWKWPDYYGENAYIGAHLRYLWTGKNGNLLGYLAEERQSAARWNCTISSGSAIYAQNTLQKKAQLGITPMNTIELLKNTGNGKEKIVIEVDVNTTTYATTTTSQCSCGLSNIICTVSKSTNTFTFTLTNADTKNSQTIPNSQITLLFWLQLFLFLLFFRLSSSSSNSDSLEYDADIYGYFYANHPTEADAKAVLINKCDEDQVWTSSSEEDRTITVNPPNRDVLAIGARTPFSFTFSTSYTVLDLSKFTIDLKFLATANTNLISNLRCAIYTTTGSTLLHLFDKFDYSSLSAVNIEYREQDTTLNIPTEIGTVSYKFLCHGGEVMETAPSSSSLINVKNILTSTIAEGQGTDQSGNYASLRTVNSGSVANVTMTKTFDIAGQDSVYKFNVKTQVLTTISTTGVETNTTRFKAGTYFYVEFARDISPRFNQMGIIRCYHESYPTYCKYESERRIAFIARTDLHHNQTYGHNFSIIGVQRPADFQNYKKMYFALVPYLSSFNELTYQNSDSIEDETTTDQSATTLPVVYFAQESGDAIRSTYSMKMHIKMPANTVVENVPIYVDFPGDFDEAMFLGWSPSCQFRNVQIDDNDTITNYANSCSLENIRRVKINMSSDSNNTDTRLYELTIGSIPTYHYTQYHSNAPLVWFGNSTATTVPHYKTNLGYFNGTFNLETFKFSDATKQLLTWDSNEIECYIGTYRCTAKLRVINSENFFYDIASFTSSGTYSDYFKFNPSNLAVDTGKAYKEFEVAPKASTAPGYYQLKWNHEQTTYYSVLPPLFLIALNSQTDLDVTVQSRAYDVPDGGRSLPIIFDFAGKMPETDLTIDGTSKSLEVNGTNYITSKYVKFVSSQQTMKFAEEYTSSQIQFVVKGEKVTGTNEPDSPQAILSWTLSGTNQASYKTPNDVTVTVVNAIVGTPELTLNNPESSSQGYQTITCKCSHPSTFYYVVSQDEDATKIEYSSIKTATEDANILETEVGTVYTNPKRTFYGYYLGMAAETEYQITITGKLQSEATHYLRMFCVNQMDTASESKNINWKQASNGGKPLISTMKFESKNNTNGTQYVSLSTTQKKEVACIICKEAKVEKDKVFGTDGVACNEEGTVASANTTNSTRRFLQTTSNATEYYVVMPDLFTSNGNQDDVKSKLESSDFSNALAASETLSDVKLNSISCSISSGYPSTPLINSPSVSPAENSITFSWTGANNTNGFVFAGVAQYTNATVDPTALQLKKNSGYSFDAFNKVFYYQDTAVSLTVSPTTKCLDYKYYWIATNEDPDTYQYTTGVKSGTTKTIGCPTFAGVISQSMLLIAFLFALMILA